MPQASLNALLAAYRDQADWLLAQAEEFRAGRRKMIALADCQEVDLSEEAATEYLHKAGNLQAIIVAYERLHAKNI